jgi:hypothetical protein
LALAPLHLAHPLGDLGATVDQAENLGIHVIQFTP